MPATPAKILVSEDNLLVREFTLGPGDEIEWHHHGEVFDVYYCLEGELQVEAMDAYTREAARVHRVPAGAWARVDVGTAHHPVNRGSTRCRFLLVQGGGRYDFIPFQARADASS